MRTSLWSDTVFLLAILLTLALPVAPGAHGEPGRRASKTITTVLRESLPPEEVSYSSNAEQIIVQGPTYAYGVERATGAVRLLRVVREGQVVITAEHPADILMDDYSLAANQFPGETEVISCSKQRIVLKAESVLKDLAGRGPDVACTLIHTFYNDGVVVSEIKLVPEGDLFVQKGIRHQLSVDGRFRHFLHKRRDQHGHPSRTGSLPAAGEAVELTTLTSCLEVFSPEAALAIFTDGGAIHLARDGLETAVLEVKQKEADRASVSLTQYIANIGPSGAPYRLEAGKPFTFRTGISLAPNRMPHRRRRDLRMFIWIGDQQHPYPSEQEILDAAHMGYTLFQMHRLGTPGQPRPPVGELERVIKQVHEAGMLFIWTANADLMYANSKGVTDMYAAGKWALWQGFNYGGRYQARMDSYCDLVATCLASPNGLAEYRLATIATMMDKYDVDGMYIDDNLAYANCSLWKEHGHPRKTYDCLIELHEMNWRRRQLLRQKCPHAVLIDHCTTGLVLPVICDFDVHLYGEGYDLSSLEGYWDFFGSINNMYAQGCLWPGDTEGARCAAAVAYNYDLLTGGGQYSYLDWRLYPKKFPYASGVKNEEPLFVRAYGLPQYYFGMYESTPYRFATSADLFSTTTPVTYATVYHNRVWSDYLIPIANMSSRDVTTSLVIHSLQKLEIEPNAGYVLYDVNERASDIVNGKMLEQGIRDIRIPANGLKLFYLRELPGDVPYHLWGGKRISESWDNENEKLVLKVHGPVGLQDMVLIAGGKRGFQRVMIAGQPASFFFDPVRRVAHGTVTFGAEPITVEITCSQNGLTNLRHKAIPPDELTRHYLRKR